MEEIPGNGWFLTSIQAHLSLNGWFIFINRKEFGLDFKTGQEVVEPGQLLALYINE